jgi:hypothetical protein
MKNILFSIAILMLSQATYAQLQVGGSVGIGIADTYFNDLEVYSNDLENLIYFQANLALEKPLKGRFSFRPELMYAKHGVDYDDKVTTSDQLFDYNVHTQGQIKLHTIEMPLLIKMRLGDNKFQAHLFAGPSIGVGMASSSKVPYFSKTTDRIFGTVETAEGSKTMYSIILKDGYNKDMLGDDKVPFNRFQVSMHMGFQVSHSFDNALSLYSEFRYMNGLNNTVPKESGSLLTSRSIRFSFALGTMYPLRFRPKAETTSSPKN